VAITFDSVGGVFQGDANEFALGSVQIPEPGSIGILTMGLMAMGAMVMRRRQA
jgi:PEP-CTERM motif